MKFDIVVEDKMIAVDDEWLEIDDTVWPEGVWAIHWDGTKGEIEYKDSMIENEEITDLKPYMHLVTAHTDQKVLNSSKTMSVEEHWKRIRLIRDKLLSDTDWMLLDDAGLTIPERLQVIAYRQELRDIPQTFANPENVVWSDRPTFTRGK